MRAKVFFFVLLEDILPLDTDPKHWSIGLILSWTVECFSEPSYTFLNRLIFSWTVLYFSEPACTFLNRLVLSWTVLYFPELSCTFPNRLALFDGYLFRFAQLAQKMASHWFWWRIPYCSNYSRICFVCLALNIVRRCINKLRLKVIIFCRFY